MVATCSQLREKEVAIRYQLAILLNLRDARGGCHVRAEWLQDHKGDEVRCRLVATQLAIGEKGTSRRSTPPSDGGNALVGDGVTAC